MKFTPTAIDGLFIATSDTQGDARGSFTRLYSAPDQLAAGLGARSPVQINHSRTVEKGTVRGLHFQQHPALEAKTVRCLKGRVYDVAVDLRAGSPTFLQHVAIELAAGDNRAFLIPPGCAHGFQTLEDDCELLYLHSAAYAPQHEGGVPHNDPRLGIRWPLPVTHLSTRDQSFAPLHPDFKGLTHAM